MYVFGGCDNLFLKLALPSRSEENIENTLLDTQISFLSLQNFERYPQFKNNFFKYGFQTKNFKELEIDFNEIFKNNLSENRSFKSEFSVLFAVPNNIDIRVGFIIGQTNESVYKKIIEKEYNQYGDLIQGNFIDSYRFFLI